MNSQPQLSTYVCQDVTSQKCDKSKIHYSSPKHGIYFEVAVYSVLFHVTLRSDCLIFRNIVQFKTVNKFD